jgi:hypothetical protein
MDPDWDQAACLSRPRDWWMGSLSEKDRIVYPQRTAAKAICDSCPIKGDCLAYARSQTKTFGIWGGKVFWDGKDREIS